MTNTPILVLGGTGKTGRRVAQQLGARDVAVRVASRSSHHRFDWYDDRTWPAAVAGVDAAYVVPPLGPDGLAKAAEFVKQAAADGVRRLVLLSGRGVGSPGRDFEVYEGSLALEHAVKDSGAAWTIVQPSWFAQNFSEDFLYDGVLAGEVRVPAGAGAEAFIDVEDLAEVVTTVLTDERHAGRTYALSGPRMLTLQEAVAEISAASGRPMRYVDVEPAQHVAELVGYGVPMDDAVALGDLFAVIRHGRSDYLSDGVQQVLGRAPRDFADWARSTAATGVWGA
jgi:uncharacterized protein YbjT (DUF2867 family)